MAITQSVMIDIKSKETFSTDEILSLLINNVNKSEFKQDRHEMEIKYNSALALSGLCFRPIGYKKIVTYDEKLQIAKITHKNQLRIFKLGGLSKADKLLEPMKDVESASFRVLPLRIGLRLLIDVCNQNRDIQTYLMSKMMDCICCNNILAKNYGTDVDVLALELIAALCAKNPDAQKLAVQHNVNHFILGTILKKSNIDKRVMLACGRALFCMGENNDAHKAAIVKLMRENYLHALPKLKTFFARR
eukprot:CAMPEP_0197519812 /NCGR_PEP_ID=MMETSP1318-20131121/5095_1 /TAXON_ID=552666 /ORGANISM="Partenskyella glossopodia, Strain RCC365" /LENGTH=246 /DNA_ID=CAMNT_0043071013 /DNA_START=163 /DNA_END=903 /DNA_ORIENTATION=+